VMVVIRLVGVAVLLSGEMDTRWDAPEKKGRRERGGEEEANERELAVMQYQRDWMEKW